MLISNVKIIEIAIWRSSKCYLKSEKPSLHTKVRIKIVCMSSLEYCIISNSFVHEILKQIKATIECGMSINWICSLGYSWTILVGRSGFSSNARIDYLLSIWGLFHSLVISPHYMNYLWGLLGGYRFVVLDFLMNSELSNLIINVTLNTCKY